MQPANSSEILCASCVEPSLQPEYPAWRQHVAATILAIHIVMLSIAAFVGVYYKNFLVKWRREPYMLLIIWIGAVALAHTPIREIMGEMNYPCISHYICAMVIDTFLMLGVLVRSLRLVAMHCLQRRLGKMLNEHTSSVTDADEDAVMAVVPTNSNPCDNSDSKAPETSSGDHIYCKTSDSRSGDHIHSKRANDSSGGCIDSEVAKTNDLEVQYDNPVTSDPVEMGRVTNDNTTTATAQDVDLQHRTGGYLSERIIHSVRTTCAALHGGMQKLFLDILHLHSTSGQLRLWLLLSIVHVVIYGQHIVVHKWAAIAENRNGCFPGSFETRNAIVALAASAALQLVIVVYVFQKRDAFKLREEIMMVAAVIVILCIVLACLRANRRVLAVTTPGYVIVITSWLLASLTFIQPAIRAARGAVKVAASPDKCPPIHPASPLIGQQSSEVSAALPTKGGGAATIQEGVGNTPAEGWAVEERDIALHLFNVAFLRGSGAIPRRSDVQARAVCSEICHELARILRQQPFVADGPALNVLTLYLCSQSDARRALRPSLQSCWCTELLLFLLDALYFYNSVTLAIRTMSRNLAAGWPRRDATRLPVAQSEEYMRSLAAACNAATDAAQQMEELYLSNHSMIPSHVSPEVVASTQRSLKSFVTLWGIIRNHLGQDGCTFNESELLLALKTFRDSFGDMEKAVFNLMALGPVLQFTAGDSFQQWRMKTLQAIEGEPSP